MKALKTSLTAVLLLAFLCGGLVSAATVTLNSDQASVRAMVSNPTPNAGDQIQVSIFFQNNYTESLQIDFIGLHFDWMPSEGFYGFNLSSTPVTVASGTDYFFQQPINVNIPSGVNGVQGYYVGVEGTVGTSSDTFSINSASAEILVSGTGPTATPSSSTNPNDQGTGPTATPSSSTNPNDQSSNLLLLYVAVIVVVVVVVLLIFVMILRKKRKRPEKTTESSVQPSSEQKPSEQDFSI
jgi:hypothetical protein